jgi:hypothetical protein
MGVAPPIRDQGQVVVVASSRVEASADGACSEVV